MAISEETLQLNHTGLQTHLDNILKRRSIRKLASGPVSDEMILHILEAARWSPSAANSQPTRMVVLKERNREFWDFIEATFKQKLQGEQLQRALNRLPGYRAGVFSIVFFEDTTIADKQLASGMPVEVVKSFASQALGIVQANVWNAIAAAGLATSNQHMNMQMEEELCDFLNVPTTWKSYSIFPVGYPDEIPAEGSRHDAKDVIFFERGPHA
ncbi:MAG: nitroreductase family protein [Ktedonobacteraceae bacterium]